MKIPSLTNIGNYFPWIRRKTSRSEGDSAKSVSRPYATVQIEVTSRCATGCVFCPHDSLGSSWITGEMPLDIYREQIAPHLGLFNLVYLQGWGEPMLHPDLWEMLRLTQEKGCQTGFTTNGAWLQGANNRRLLDMGVNLISVSFAGSSAQAHETLRVNSQYTALCQNFSNLASLKKQGGYQNPWLELHFLMTRANLAELPAVVALAAELGADEVAATNLTYSPTLALDRMHVFADQPLQEHLEVIDRAREAAAQVGIPLRVYPLKTEPQTLVCDADPMHAIYINHLGEISPCVYLGLPIQGDPQISGQIPRYYQGELNPIPPLSFGNISQGLPQALEGRSRRAFKSAFQRRDISSSPLASFTYLADQSSGGELPPPPEPCRYCYKMLGV